jgi:hypothetical protein
MKSLKSTLNALLVACLCMAVPAGAELIQHLDASVLESVVVSGNAVVQWNDLSGMGNDATSVNAAGTVMYPSTPFPGGMPGLDFGLERNDLILLDSAGTEALLNFSPGGAAEGNTGFTVFIAFHVDVKDPTGTEHILGNWTTLDNFAIRIRPGGEVSAIFDNQRNTGQGTLTSGDTVVCAFSFDVGTGDTWIYASKDPVEWSSGGQGAKDYAHGRALYLGSPGRDNGVLMGAVGEVMIFNEFIDRQIAEPYLTQLVYKWVTPVKEKLKPGALVPPDGSEEMPIDGVVLSWKAGLDSVNQNVYIGTDADAVANATPENPMGVFMETQTETSYALPVLDYGTTYYYRIESINGEVYSSPVASFETIEYAYPLDGDYITATASSAAGALNPNATCNGAGLDPNNAHNTNFNAMWVSDPGQEGPVWIQYDFDAAVRLNEILIWNHNSEVENFLGWGTKDAIIEYTVDGLTWQSLAEVTLAQAPGATAYVANNSIPVNDLTVEGVRINALTTYSEILPGWPGLSEVQFLVVPLLAADPVPTNGQMNVSLNPLLSKLHWTAGRGAVSHDLFVSTDLDAVASETVAPIALTDASYELPSLNVNTVYYWKVNENTGAEVWTGNLWGFTTVATVVLDGMEAYGTEENVIYATWIDGYEDPDKNGALVGADPYLGDGDPFTPGDGVFDPESIVIRSGLQSLPIWFDNSVAPTSEVTRNLTGAEIPDVGASKMVLFYRFGADSVGDELYVEINGVEVAGVAVPATILPLWSEMSIDLTMAGIADATQVTSLTLGVRGANAKGVVYLDDVSLTN